jgi:glucose-1-phosphate thymidylyltransferase
MSEAGADRAYVILREGKWDVPAYLGEAYDEKLPLAYLVLRESSGVPYTLDCAHPFVEDATVLLGFPDIVLRSDRPVYPALVDALTARPTDLVLGLFPSTRPEKGDMVETEADGRVRRIVVKSPTTSLNTGWVGAAWGPAFSSFVHEYLTDRPSSEPGAELHLGQVFQGAIDAGLGVQSVLFSGSYVDVGTPEDLAAYAAE